MSASTTSPPPFSRPPAELLGRGGRAPGGSPEDLSLRRGIKWSVGAHVAVAVLALFKGFVFPGKPELIVPTLRVDLVGLPDVLKKDKFKVPPLPAQPKEDAPPPSKAAPKSEPQPAPPKAADKAEPADPSEMLAKPKQAAPAHDTKARQNRLKNALDRIKALNKITAEEESAKETPAVVKGNRISKGASVSDDARESDQASYYDLVRDQLQQNWSLVPWLARQNLSARVVLTLDAQGRLKGMRFVRFSGNAQFDETVKRTIQASNPFPAPPAELAGKLGDDGITVGFPL